MTREEWLEARRNGIGGSDASTIMGVNPWSSPYALFLEKAGLSPGQEDSERMMWGRKLEPVVRQHYIEVTGRTLEPGVEMRQHPERPHLFANTDGTILPCEGHPSPGVYEGKTTSVYNKDDWAHGNVPLYYQVQAQAYLYVLEAEWASFGVLIGGQEFQWVDVPRNDRFIRAYVKKADEFWDRVKTNNPPPLEGHPAERRALAHLHPDAVDGKVIDLQDEVAEWAAKMEEARKAESEAEKAKEQYATLIRGAMGDALFGRLPDGSGFKLALEHRKEYVRQASSSRVLRKVKRVP